MAELSRKMARDIALVALCLFAAGCSRQVVPDGAGADLAVAIPVDFSGSWEIDYSRGYDVQESLTRLFRQMNRSARNAASPASSRSRNINIGPSAGSVAAIIAPARLADVITRSQVLTINQGEGDIRVDRDDDFALTCDFSRGVQHSENPFGTELCGWDGEHFVFHVTLPEGLSIDHRLTIAPDRENLYIATTVASGASRVPFTLGRFYTRFEPPESESDCVETFSKKRVCTARQPDR